MSKVFIVAGPSGVGKNSIINKAIAEFSNLKMIPTYTTRQARKDDLINKNRVCINLDVFSEMKKRGDLFEYKKFNNNYYGKRKIDFENEFRKGNSLILEIDTQGLDDYKKAFGGNLISIFICYENLEALGERIKTNRPDASLADINSRSIIAKKEMAQKDRYDYVVINIENHPEIATEKVLNIIQKEIDK